MAARPRLYSHTQCAQCRRRKKKCDEAKPVCSACQRLQLPCTWETPEKKKAKNALIKDLNPTFEMLEKRQRDQGKPRTLDLSGFEDSVCAAYVLDECYKGSNFGFDALKPSENGWTVQSTLTFAPPDNSLAWGCMGAQGLLFTGARYQEHRLIKAGTIQYSKMTKEIGAAIADPTRRFDMDTLASINNIGLVSITTTSPETHGFTTESFSHSAGLATLMGMMQPEQFQSERALALFEHMRYAIIIIATMCKRQIVLTSDRWKTIPWAKASYGKNHMHQLLDILCDIVPLQTEIPLFEAESTDTGIATVGQTTRRTLQGIYSKLHHWRNSFAEKMDICCNSTFQLSDSYRWRVAPSVIKAVNQTDLWALGIFNMILLYLCRIAAKEEWFPVETTSGFGGGCQHDTFEALQPSLATPVGIGAERGKFAAFEIISIWEFTASKELIGMGTIYLSQPLWVAFAFLSDFSSNQYDFLEKAMREITTFWAGGRI